MDEKNWLLLLIRINALNRRLKEPGWNYADKDAAYRLKDTVLSKILQSHPADMKLSMYYVPYVKYSNISKDKAGSMMRADNNRYPFEWYLSQVEPSQYDYEIKEKATVEIVIEYMGIQFSFHQPMTWMEGRGFNVRRLPKKAWISADDFNRAFLVETTDVINNLLSNLEEIADV